MGAFIRGCRQTHHTGVRRDVKGLSPLAIYLWMNPATKADPTKVVILGLFERTRQDLHQVLRKRQPTRRGGKRQRACRRNEARHQQEHSICLMCRRGKCPSIEDIAVSFWKIAASFPCIIPDFSRSEGCA
ncbi:hypothetical protein GJAV_G00213810 [Gymnothorax javanicus]|nr:hypothetical protein GJAV_G00213810 [Gymnothorax javanicus]